MKRLNLLLIFYLVFFPIVVFALDMDECNIGDSVYIDEFFSNKKVVITDKNNNNNTVQVKFPNGEKKWIAPSELITEWGNAGDQLMQFAAIAGAEWVYEKINEDSKKSGNSDLSARRVITEPDKGRDGGYYFHVENKCHKTVKLALIYKPVNGEWKTEYWYYFPPNKLGRLKGITSKSSIFYIYAISKDESSIWGGSDISEEIDGKKIGMKKINDEHGLRNILLNCNS